jgi:hypothetical protein
MESGAPVLGTAICYAPWHCCQNKYTVTVTVTVTMTVTVTVSVTVTVTVTELVQKSSPSRDQCHPMVWLGYTVTVTVTVACFER